MPTFLSIDHPSEHDQQVEGVRFECDFHPSDIRFHEKANHHEHNTPEAGEKIVEHRPKKGTDLFGEEVALLRKVIEAEPMKSEVESEPYCDYCIDDGGYVGWL